MKIKIPVVLTTMVKSTKPIAKTNIQLAKPVKITIRYPCIICSSAKHRFGECPRKIEVQNMFKGFKGSCVQGFKV
jgi:hypothetical protein